MAGCGISGMCVGWRGLGFGCGGFLFFWGGGDIGAHVTCLKDLVCTDPHWCVCGVLCCGGTPCSGSMQAAVPVASQTAAATPTSVGDVMAALYGGVVCGALGSGNGWQCLDAVGAMPSSHAPPPHPRPAPPCPVHSLCCARHSGWTGGGGSCSRQSIIPRLPRRPFTLRLPLLLVTNTTSRNTAHIPPPTHSVGCPALL
jgi:hypothetical protein